MRTGLLLCAMVAAGCGGAANHDVEGPFTGATRRFYVASLTLPQQQSDFAEDLNGDGRPDNELGTIVGAATGERLANEHIDEIVAAGAPMIIEITSDDPALRNDATVGVRFVGEEGAKADMVGARIDKGLLSSNRVWLMHHEKALVRLPMFVSADPVRLPLDFFELELAADGDGGFIGQLQGGVPASAVVDAFYGPFAQMLKEAPNAPAINAFDTNHDGKLLRDEFAMASLTQAMLAPDVQISVPANEHKDHVSLAFSFTLAPCPDDACTRPTPAPSCFDRVLNGDETDVDCGGSCGACAGGDACTKAADCVTLACDDGACRAPSCSDGLQDGFESGLDCGPGCDACKPADE